MPPLLAEQLAPLMRERERLEQFLMLDANWRALRQLEQREAAGQPVEAIDGSLLHARLLEALAGNRIYAARVKIMEAIELLREDAPRPPADGDTGMTTHGVAEPRTLASRIVLLDSTLATAERPIPKQARPLTAIPDTHAPDPIPYPHVWPAKPVPAPIPLHLPVLAVPEPGLAPTRRSEPAQLYAPRDELTLISGIDRATALLLRAGGVSRFAQIAAWTAWDVAHWHTRIFGGAERRRRRLGSWIEQAAVLTAGCRTHHARRIEQGDQAALVPTPSALPQPISPLILSPILPQVTAAPEATLADVTAKSSVGQAGMDGEFDDVHSDEAVITIKRGHGVAPANQTMSKHHRNSTRPRSLTLPLQPRQDEGDSDVAIVPRTAPRLPSPIPQPIRQPSPVDATPASSSLLRRLKRASEAAPFDAGDYAAYRGHVEEASVTIVRPGNPSGTARANTSDTKPPPLPGRDPDDQQVSVDRFLRALTGKS